MNFRAVGLEILLFALAGAGPGFASLHERHPAWTWIGLASTVAAYLYARLSASPVQAKVIDLQKKELDSLRPPKPENDP